MAVPLNRLAYGLLDFFGIKSGEWGPRELNQALQPTLDLSRWYLDQNAQEYRWSFAAFNDQTATNQQITQTFPTDICGLVTAGELIVPPSETWLLLEADVYWTMAAAGGSMHMGYNVGGSGEAGPFRMPMQTMGFTTGIATITRAGCAALLHPYWCRPGARIAVANDGTIGGGAGNSFASGRLRIMRMTR